MPTLTIHTVPALRDNYCYLLHCAASGATAVVDPSEAEPIDAALAAHGLRLTHILNTHHHADHTGGNRALAARWRCEVIGPADEATPIPTLNRRVRDGDDVQIGDAVGRVLSIPGHTLGHVAFHFAAEGALFCGDTLFSLGCGRLFEGTAAQMWRSLEQLRGLPDATRVFCGHEYTENNTRFALSLDPADTALAQHLKVVQSRRATGEPTVPSLLADEKRLNPFLRADHDRIAECVGLRGAAPEEVFAELRRRKDQF